MIHFPNSRRRTAPDPANVCIRRLPGNLCEDDREVRVLRVSTGVHMLIDENQQLVVTDDGCDPVGARQDNPDIGDESCRDKGELNDLPVIPFITSPCRNRVIK